MTHTLTFPLERTVSADFGPPQWIGQGWSECTMWLGARSALTTRIVPCDMVKGDQERGSLDAGTGTPGQAPLAA